MATRAAQRKQRLLELENEQRIEDAEALKFTDEQKLSLFLSFRSVKFEWSDLDGMRYVRRRYNSSCPASPPPAAVRSPVLNPTKPPSLTPPQPEAFAVLTNARLATFGKDDTIRGYVPSSPERYCSTPTPYDSAPRYHSKLEYPVAPTTPAPAPPMMTRSISSPPAPVRPPPAPPAMRRSPSSSSPSTAASSPSPKSSNSKALRGKRRSPVKGLFSVASSSVTAQACVQPIRVPLPPLVSSASLVDSDSDSSDDDDDDDAWVDEDDLTVIAEDDRQDDADDGLLTPVPAAVWRFGSGSTPAPVSPPALTRPHPVSPPALPVLRVDIGAPPAYSYDDEGEGEPVTPVPYERAVTPTPGPFAPVDQRQEQAQLGEKRKR
ncbi:hypothetical protein MSAN_01636800 [Mycena sanguinolenta]|uniref:Uncharacterized protein n=1 Tax=Mycena sanguinolenta TaxID=230812 RepID=A0A8H7CWH1_9AGAR|nr:hypothetical protein MSAN_01636800 [Mycena sanguinolenta]